MIKAAKQGFTLIELLVVVSIIGILATLIVANLNAARSRARDAVRKADMNSVRTALRLYYNDVGSYPAATAIVWGEPFSSGSTVYMNALPKDPLPDHSYQYSFDPVNETFTLTACLENKSDTKCDTDLDGNILTCADGAGCQYSVEP